MTILSNSAEWLVLTLDGGGYSSLGSQFQLLFLFLIFLEAKQSIFIGLSRIRFNNPFSCAYLCSLEAISSCQLAREFGGSGRHIEPAIREGIHFLLEKWSDPIKCHQQN
ncbi:hypothetical protein SLA2020_407270 [Shorea laevis]